MNKLGIVDLLQLRGFAPTGKVKLVRHQDSRWDVHELLRSGWLETYQRFQGKPVFDGLEYIVSFVGLEGSRARLLGVYRVCGSRPSGEVPLPPGRPFSDWQKSGICYDLERDEAFAEFEHRIVVDWGKGALAWHQHLTNKEVVEMLPAGQLLQPFRDYLDFTLTYPELKSLLSNPEANKEWRARLSAVAGVYLVLATVKGEQYVGSACGAEGIWGRWSAYARDGHGGNAALRELVQNDPAYPHAFSYSLLQILSRTLTVEEVLGWESRYKEKLGSRAVGLGLNRN
ncbi:MAG: GIY-YIG nuclease family protein [Holophagales bacterium]|nr:GIY-YIG nuclease family protein [Holophagales bacterium]